MIGLIVKIIVCPLVVYVSTLLFPNLIYYPYGYQPIIVGLILAVADYSMEVLFLRRGTFWISTLIDYFAAAVMIYIISLFMIGSSVTLGGVLVTAFLLTITEIIQHIWLIKTGKIKRLFG